MKIVCISDTHQNNVKNLPEGDILTHSGDWSSRGTNLELSIFCEQLKQYKKNYKNIVIIAGNHDFIAEKNHNLTKQMIEDTGAIYLNDSGIEIEGIKFWGSPVSPWFHNWAFNRWPDQIQKHWDMIPEDTQVLLTHCPPHGFGDTLSPLGSVPGAKVGCPLLLKKIESLPNLKAITFGHIHEGHGEYEHKGIKVINASVLDDRYRQVNKPIVIEI